MGRDIGVGVGVEGALFVRGGGTAENVCLGCLSADADLLGISEVIQQA